jgi:adenosylmethionine---8-amino-7-oxononanoate aminotransferase
MKHTLAKESIWHPFTQERIADKPLEVAAAKDEFLYLKDERKLIDGISSWWTINHGHCHPAIVSAIQEQVAQLDHVIFAGFTHAPAQRVAENVLSLLGPHFAKVFFSDNGSTAVEIAVKMALQYHYNLGKPKRALVALEGAFHGETFGAMSVSSRHGFDDAFVDHLFPIVRLPVPNAENLETCKQLLMQYQEENGVAAFIFEPLLMGAGGMIVYASEVLDELIGFCKQQGILTIADEVMTGFGRTGLVFAVDHLRHKPDIICLAKGLTGGVLPLSLTVCTQEIYEAFYSMDKRKAFYHGHSFTGNPIASAAALASTTLALQEDFLPRLQALSNKQREFVDKYQDRSLDLSVRSCGTVLAINFPTQSSLGYFSDLKEKLISFFMEREIFIRPLGHVLYAMPPYCISEESMTRIHSAFEEAIELYYEK